MRGLKKKWALAFYVLNIFSVPNVAYAVCAASELPRQFYERAASVASIEAETEPLRARLFSIAFDSVSILATNFDCDREREVRFPEFSAFGWIVEIPESAHFTYISLQHSFQETVNQSEFGERYRVFDQIIIDTESGQEFVFDSTLGFFLENREFFDYSGEPAVLISGPFWDFGSIGPVPVGLDRPSGSSLLNQSYINFSAGHVLCLTDNNGPTVEYRPSSSLNNPVDRMDDYALERCQNGAFQVGPAYFDPSITDPNGPLLPGISGLSNTPSNKSILISTESASGQVTHFLLTTISDIGAFDAMVMIHALVDELGGETKLRWAVGMQDDSFLSGPIILRNDHVYRHSDIDIPVAGILIVEQSSQ